ncbi:hypothetical protein [Haloplanus natans]|nr:hypothetical protein [Haloplanus natans]
MMGPRWSSRSDDFEEAAEARASDTLDRARDIAAEYGVDVGTDVW